MDTEFADQLLALFESYQHNSKNIYLWKNIAQKLFHHQQYKQTSSILLSCYQNPSFIELNNTEKVNFLYLMTLCLFYSGHIKEGLEISDILYISRPVESIIDTVSRNLRFYIQQIQYTQTKQIKPEQPLLDNGERWNSINPSIIAVNNINPNLFPSNVKFLVNSRTINYKEDNSNYYSRSKDGIVRTRNILVLYDNDFNIISQHEMLENYIKVKPNHHITGLEDCRITMNGSGQVYFTTATFDNHHFPIPKISIGTYHTNNVINSVNSEFKVEKLNVFPGPDVNRCEKNWCPFIFNSVTKKVDPYGDKLCVIYSYSPLIVYEVNYEKSTLNEYKELCDYSKNLFSGFRGSAGPIPFLTGSLLIVHEVIFIPQGNRYIRNYFHRLVWLNESFKIQKISFPFYFTSKRIEYCCGMCNSGDDIIVTVGVEDASSQIYQINNKVIENMLHDIPSI